MSSSLYEEAIADAMAIREAAESRAKQQLIESMTPQIKDLVEKKLMEEIEEKEYCEDDDNKIVEKEQQECGQYEGDIEEISLEDDSNSLEKDKDMTEEVYQLNNESFDVLKKLGIKNKIKTLVTNKINNLQEDIRNLKTALTLSENRKLTSLQKSRINNIYKKLVLETKNIEFNDIIKSDRNLYETFIQLNKELQTMSRRRRRSEGFLNESLEDLLETSLFLEDDEAETEELPLADLEDLSKDADADADADADTDADADGEDKASEDEANEDADADSDVDLDLSELMDEDLESVLKAALKGMEMDSDEDEDEEIDESYMPEEDLDEEGDHVAEMMDGEMMDDDHDHEMNEVYLEIDEKMLQNEIANMKRIRESNVHAEISDVPSETITEDAFKNVERKNRLLEGKLQQYAKALKGMKSQLTEMNLFNAKLLYANKLMQNKDLSIKQQRHIVESLDEASTLNEAKLLFESLSKSLVKSRNGESLNESASRKVLGSSSKATRSAQPSKTQNVEVDRWATLAGIKK